MGFPWVFYAFQHIALWKKDRHNKHLKNDVFDNVKILS